MRVGGKKKPFALDRKIINLSVFGFLCALILALLVNLSINTLSGVRAYVSGQGEWVKAQKQSLLYLNIYIFTGDEEMYRQFMTVNDVMIGDMEARVEMVKDDRDLELINQGLSRGFNHPDDVFDLLNVYKWFQWVPQVQKAFEAWKEGDQKNMELVQYAKQIHDTYSTTEVDKAQQQQWTAYVVRLENEFNVLENEFKQSLGNIARLVNSILKWSTFIFSSMLFGIGGFLLLRLSQGARSWADTLKENEFKFHSMLNNSRDVLYKMNLADESYEYVSGGLKDMIGYETSEFLKGGPQWIYSKIHPEDKENMAKVIKRYKEVNKDQFMPIVEFRLQDIHGNYKWVSNSRTLMKDANGNPVAIVGTVRDISDLKAQEEQLRQSLTEKEILLQEIHHRVKNNLSIVISLLELQKDGMTDDVQQMLSDSQSRIKSIAKVHEKLYKSTTLAEIPMDAYITELAEEIAKAYESNKKDIAMEVDVEPFIMELNEAIPCGLVLNELINNGYKHGFEGINKGIVRVRVNKKEECMQLIVENNGHAMPENFNPMEHKSMGMTLIQVLIQRFNGELSIESGEWTRFKICFKP